MDSVLKVRTMGPKDRSLEEYCKWSNKCPGRVQEGAFNIWEAFILVTQFNELNKTVYNMLSAKNVCVLTESRLLTAFSLQGF